jgi:hypothetical protein
MHRVAFNLMPFFPFDVPMLLTVVLLYVKTLVVVLIGFRFIMDIQGEVFPMGYPVNAPSPYPYFPSLLKYNLFM